MYLGLGTVCGFRQPPGGLGTDSPKIKGVSVLNIRKARSGGEFFEVKSMNQTVVTQRIMRTIL